MMGRYILSMVQFVAGVTPGLTSNVVVTASGNIYVFYGATNNSDLYYKKSTNRGLTWDQQVVIRVGTIEGCSVWYDRWTPGDTGDLIHLVYGDSGTDDVFYRSLNTSTDSFTAAEVVAAANSTHGTTGCKFSITKAIGGNLYIAADVDGGTEQNFVRSTDGGGTWAARTTFHEASGTDHFHLVPGFAADTQDIMCMFWDGTASEISRKVYDDSGNSWAETSISTGMTAIALTSSSEQFTVSVDDANNKILLAAWSNRDTLNADLRFWSIDESSITEGTNIVLNSTDDQTMVALTLDKATGIIYAYYCGKSDGSQDVATSTGVYCKASTDGGTNWGPETEIYGSLNYAWRFLMAPLVVDGTGPWLTTCEEVGNMFVTGPIASAKASFNLGI